MTSVASENAFMADLFADLDASIFSEPPSSIKSKSSSQSPVLSKRKFDTSKTDTRHSRPLVQLSQSPSPRKRVVKKAKVEDPSSSNSQYKRANERKEEIRAAAEALFNCTDDWTCDLNSPETKKTQSQRLNRQQQQQQHTRREDGKALHTYTNKQKYPYRDERYTRCIVKEVVLDHYIPQKYLDAPPEKHTTKGVLPKTVTSAMQRRQKIIYVCDLERIESTLSDERRKGKQKEGKRRKIVLRDEWHDTPAEEGDVLHLIGEWKEEKDTYYKGSGKREQRIEIDLDDPDEALWDDMEEMPSLSQDFVHSILPTMTLSSNSKNSESKVDNLLILHPDVLLSATAISTVIHCTRKAYLQNKLKASGPANEDSPSESLLMGRMLHEVLQSCLTGRPKELKAEKQVFDVDVEIEYPTGTSFPITWQGPGSTDFSHQFVKEQIHGQVQNSLEDILSAGLDTQTAVDKLWKAALPFAEFALRYLVGDQDGRPKIEAVGVDKKATIPPLVLVKRVLDVEEDIWSPMYGLKGFVDVSVEVEILERDETTRNTTKRIGKTVLMPLEIKTGRSIDIVQHQAQTMLYNLMMSDRYDRKVNVGLLYYSQSSTLHLVRSQANEVKALLRARNELANYLHKKSEGDSKVRGMLPPTIDRERDCSRCYISDECMLYKRTIEKSPMQEESSITTLYEAKTEHLTQKHADFFQHWEQLLSLEEDDIVRFRRELWTMTAVARESTGRCLANMKIVKDSKDYKSSKDRSRTLSGMNDRVTFHFSRADQSQLLLGGNLSVGDPISVSVEPNVYSVAQGHILELSPYIVTLTLDRDLNTITNRCEDRSPIFRIDKEEFASGMAKVRYNLAKLFFAPPHGDIRRRDLIVDLCMPRFDDREGGACMTFTSTGINDDQKAAVRKALSAQDYALIVGMPGTGKTTTIVELIKQLIKKGKSVLLSSYTHSAVDTICRKLISEDSVTLLRLGKSDRVHKDIHDHTFKGATSVEELRDQLLKPNVVATTCLSISHALFAQRHFDYCIVDEASQITLPTCLGPLRFADRFVLVGDPLQLPPLVKNAIAKEKGLDISLFDLLQKAHPHSAVELQVQYRMNKDIMKLSNTLIYNGQLRCGNEKVGNSRLELDDLGKVQQIMHPRGGSEACGRKYIMDGVARCWMDRVLDEMTCALFIDTDLIPGGETRISETLLENKIEAEIVIQISSALVLAGVPSEEIAVITPYRQQLRALVKGLGSNSIFGEKKIEVLTADKSQGRDKDVVIISLVRSSRTVESQEGGGVGGDDAGVGQLLNDVKRINVALTRARKKLIIVGSRQTLSRSDLLRRLWDLMKSNGWTMALSEGQLAQHRTNLGATAAAVTATTSPSSNCKPSKKVNKASPNTLFQGRPILQDIFNEVV